MKASGKLVAGILVLPAVLAFGYFFAQREPAKHRFYVDDDLESDVWEIPVIEPHRLIATEPASAPQNSNSRWDFAGGKLDAHAHPDSINYQKGFITFHDPSQNQYGFYELQQNKTTFLSSYQQFGNFTQSKGLDKTLYNAESVYRCWIQTRQLPWAKEIFIQNYASSTRN